ncbi:MAG: DUF5994 family protein [Mycobacterium sp.]|uniref:DUF5994 family protein n=1 Tax=Mycobacterium sp. TaxID=1785 RepID=UPI003C6A0B07
MNDDPQVGRPIVDADNELRLQLKPDPPASAYLDGVWWPRSTQLAIELPGLVARLSDRLGQVTMVGYHLDAWPETPPQVEIAGLTVQLQGFTSNDPASVIVFGRDGHYITLLVIPSDVSDEIARQELDAGSQRADGGMAVNNESQRAAAQSLIEVAAQLARRDGRGDVQRSAEITRWCEEAAQQFVSAPIQAFVPILVEHIVRNRMNAPRPATTS